VNIWTVNGGQALLNRAAAQKKSDQRLNFLHNGGMGDDGEASNLHSRRDRLQYVMSWVAVSLITAMALSFFARIVWLGWKEKAWYRVSQDHFAAVVGLPAAAVAALFLVLVLRIASGPIEVEFGSLKFKGAAAPIVFWLLCFLAIAGSIKMLWMAT
jgi:hypothetical protein